MFLVCILDRIRIRRIFEDFGGDSSVDSMIDFAKSSILGRSLGTNTEAPKASVLACHMLAGPPYEAQGEETRTL